MQTIHSFPQFSQFPAEVRNRIWEFACFGGSMELSLIENLSWVCFGLVPQWVKHIKDHQKQRMNILHVNAEARYEALRHLELILEYDFPLFIASPEKEETKKLLPKTELKPRVMALDWDNDLISVPWYPDKVKRGNPMEKITRLEISASSGPCYISRRNSTPQLMAEWAKTLLETFTGLRYLRILFDESYHDDEVDKLCTVTAELKPGLEIQPIVEVWNQQVSITYHEHRVPDTWQKVKVLNSLG
ncbi:hypothetical protein F5Y12DRAFT_709317 [Xylaria sp. FL1777]|nr:hypothetical protein F5Y12DRAFT_709317 [Xylaria sp. FL1777]